MGRSGHVRHSEPELADGGAAYQGVVTECHAQHGGASGPKWLSKRERGIRSSGTAEPHAPTRARVAIKCRDERKSCFIQAGAAALNLEFASGAVFFGVQLDFGETITDAAASDAIAGKRFVGDRKSVV